MKKLASSILATGLMLAAAAALGQQPPLSVPAAREDGARATASIRGYVVRAGGAALAKAEVMLRPVEGRSPLYGAVTGNSGEFALENIQVGNYRLHVERDGYVDREYGQISSSRPGTVLVLVDGQEVRDVVVSMVPTGTIAGRIYGEDGEPIEGVNVQAMRFDYNDGERVLNSASQARTNDLGEYRLYWLTPGEYRVSATFQNRARAEATIQMVVTAAEAVGRGGLTFLGPTDALRAGLEDLQVRLGGSAGGPVEEIYVDTYYPGTHDPLASSPIQVAAGSEVRAVDFRVLPTRAVTVRGRVVGPYSPDEGFVPTVTIVPQNSALAPRRNSLRVGRGRGRSSGGRDGTFELSGIAPGSYTIVATVRAVGGRGGRGAGGEPRLAGFADVQVGGQDIDNLVVAVQQSVPVMGRVLLEPGTSEIDVSRLRVRLEPMGSLPLGGINTRVEDDGAFTLDNVNQTWYRVSLTGLPEEAYVSAARVGAFDALNSGMLVTPDAGLLEFSIDGGGSRIEGAVALESTAAFTGAQVVLVPENAAREDLYEVASADQYGRFSMRGIAPGRYRLFAWEDAPSGAYRDPEFVRRYENFGEAVEVNRGALIQSQPRLIPADR